MSQDWKDAIQYTAPIAMGYYPAGIAFGVLWVSAGLPIYLAPLASLLIYSGAAQYATIPLLATGAGILTLVINTFVINLRHIFYALPLLDQLPKTPLKKTYCLHTLTDESFSLLTTLNTDIQARLFTKIVFLNQFYWISATFIGAFLGEHLNTLIPNLDFALPCLFVILLYGQYLMKHIIWPIILAIIVFLWTQTLFPNYAMLLAISLSALLIIIETKFSDIFQIHIYKKAWGWIGFLGVGIMLWYFLNHTNTSSTSYDLSAYPLAISAQITAIILMGLVTFLLRAAPVSLPKAWFQSDVLKALNHALPLSVITILILMSLYLDGMHINTVFHPDNFLLYAQILALLCVSVIFRFKQNVLLAMITGVSMLNVILYYLK